MSKYLLFDADGTLYDFQASAQISLKKVFEYNAIAYTPGTRELYEEGNHWCWDQYEKGLMTQEDLKTRRFQILFDKLSLSQDAFVAGELYIQYLSENGIMLPGAIDFLDSINDERKSIITNGIAKTQHGRISRSNTRGYFDQVFISQEMGVQKPDKAFFDYVLKSLGKKPEECLVIGDSEKSDILGAVNAKIDSVYISFDGSTSEMATYNVSGYDELYRLIKSL